MTTEGDMTSSSSEDDEQLSDSESDSESGYDTESDNKDNASEEEDEEEDNTAQEEARHQRVRTDMDEMQRMIIDMEKVKMRLQFRFAAERQSKLERLAREEQEREVRGAAERKAEEGVHSRRVEMGVQTEINIEVLPQQIDIPVSSHNCTQPNLVTEGVPSDAEFQDEPPPKARPAGLRLYDLVKASGLDLSLKAPSPVRRAEPPDLVLPKRSSSTHDRLSPSRHQYPDEDVLNERATVISRRDWHGSALVHDQYNIDGEDDSDDDDDSDDALHHNARSYSTHDNPLRHKDENAPAIQYDENVSSISNSLVSDGGIGSGVVPSSLHRKQEQKSNPAALLSTVQLVHSSIDDDDDKTDDQREVEAIQCLLFDHMGQHSRRYGR